MDDLDALLIAARDQEPGAMVTLMPLLLAELRAFFGARFPVLEVDDLAQQTAMVVMDRLPGFVPRRSLRGWVFGIARNKALQQLRKQGSELAFLLEYGREPDDWGPGLSTHVRSEDYRRTLLKRITQLPPEYRAVIENDLAEGDLDQLAAKLDIKRGTMRTRRFRALDCLRDLFTPSS